jgi:hypothetical protein
MTSTHGVTPDHRGGTFPRVRSSAINCSSASSEGSSSLATISRGLTSGSRASACPSGSQPLRRSSCRLLHRRVRIEKFPKFPGTPPCVSVGFEVPRHPALVPIEQGTVTLGEVVQWLQARPHWSLSCRMTITISSSTRKAIDTGCQFPQGIRQGKAGSLQLTVTRQESG